MIHQYASLKTRVDLLNEALDSVAHGVLIVTGQGEILEQNRAAAGILGEAEGWQFGSDRPRPASASDGVRFGSLLIAAANTGPAALPRCSMTVSRPSGKRPFLVSIERLSSPALLVAIVDPESGVRGAADLLRQLYGLTRAEARLAEELAAGFTTRQSAARLGVSIHTVRTQIRAIFSKTGVRRQSELVRVMHLHASPILKAAGLSFGCPKNLGSVAADCGNIRQLGYDRFLVRE